MWHKNIKSPSWFEQQNKQFADTRSIHRQLSCTHLVAEWTFTYQSCDRSLWLPDHLQCLLAHGGSVNNKRFTKSIKKLSMNKSDRLIIYEVYVTLASSTQQCYSFTYFSVVFSVQRFLNVQKSLGGQSKNSVTLQHYWRHLDATCRALLEMVYRCRSLSKN